MLAFAYYDMKYVKKNNDLFIVLFKIQLHSYQMLLSNII